MWGAPAGRGAGAALAILLLLGACALHPPAPTLSVPPPDPQCRSGKVQLAGFVLRRPEDPERAAALALLREVAGGGYPPAQDLLGTLSLPRKPAASSKDWALSAGLFRTAADAGFARAQCHLGELMQAGHGLPRDPAGAVALFRKAAAAGDACGQRDLGDALREGLGVAANPDQGGMWLHRAAANGTVPPYDRPWEIDPDCPGLKPALAGWRHPPARITMEDEELAVYAAALPDSAANAGRIQFLHDATMAGSALHWIESDWRSHDGLDIAGDGRHVRLPVALLESFLARNALSYRIAKPIPVTRITVEPTDARDVEGADTVIGGDGKVSARHPRARMLPGVRVFSRVAFDAGRTLALVEWGDLCGTGPCADSKLGLFEKRDGGWHRFALLSDVAD